MTPQKFGKLILASVMVMLMISACGGADATPTPTEVSLEAIYTAAAATVFASGTGTAGAQPSKTLTPTATVSPTPTVTGTPAATRAAVVYVQPVYSVVITTTGTPGTLVPSATATFGAVGCNNSTIAQDIVVPNLTVGETFTKTWKIKNIGTCAWNGSYKFTYIGGDLMNSDTTKIRTTVAIGGTYNQNLKFTAPNAPGTYTGYWRLADDTGALFGAAFSVVVTVPGATYTPTSKVSTTPSKTSAPTASKTSTPAATNTTAPAATNTTAPAATNTTAPVATETTAPAATNTTAPVATETTAPAATETATPG